MGFGAMGLGVLAQAGVSISKSNAESFVSFICDGLSFGFNFGFLCRRVFHREAAFVHELGDFRARIFQLLSQAIGLDVVEGGENERHNGNSDCGAFCAPFERV
jgi:hypothetical protein